MSIHSWSVCGQVTIAYGRSPTKVCQGKGVVHLDSLVVGLCMLLALYDILPKHSLVDFVLRALPFCQDVDESLSQEGTGLLRMAALLVYLPC